MSSLESAKQLVSDLSAKVQSGDIEGGKPILDQIKLAMLSFPAPLTPEHLTVAISGLEWGVLLSVADDDLSSFVRNISQVKTYYASTPPSSTPNEQKCQVLGLNLMYLLVENQLSEFHAELELLSDAEAQNPLVSFPITLERQLMVGSYDEVLNAKMHIPHPSYTLFMDNLLQTVRDSIADCLEVAYKTMTVEEAMRMIKFESVEEVMEYVKEFRDDWIVEDGKLCFQLEAGGRKASDVPSMTLIKQSLSYATELERIV